MDKQNDQVSVFNVFVVSSLIIAFGCLLYQIWDTDFIYQYRKHYSSNSHLVLDFNDINSNTIENEIKDGNCAK